jgi:hypothetical protein
MQLTSRRQSTATQKNEIVSNRAMPSDFAWPRCSLCGASGECIACNGTGDHHFEGDAGYCTTCGGSGKCPACQGTGASGAIPVGS